MTREEKAAEIIDSLLVLFELYKEDYSVIRDALEFIAETRRKNPRHPITVALALYMREQKLID